MEEERAPRYVLPRHPSENDRLNLLTWAINTMNGAGWLSPVTDPHDVLDVGCGTGQWAYSIARRFEKARVVGIDVLDFRDAGPPPNFEFREVNVLEGLPFPDSTFDYVHQRLMVAAYPINRFAGGIAELVRVARPGAWVELLEAVPPMEQPGPVTSELWSYFERLGRSVDQDTEGVIPRRLERYLTEAGLANVRTRTVVIPMGPWGAKLGTMQGAVGEMMSVSFRSLLDKLGSPPRPGQPSPFERLGLKPERHREMVATMLTEFNQYESSFAYKSAFGQLPR